MTGVRTLLRAGLGSLAVLGGVLAAEPAAPAATLVSEGRTVLVLGFDVLASFPYALPDISAAGTESPAAPAQKIPDEIRAFSGRLVAVSGYMMPLQLENGRARQFVLVRNLASCCYGVAPNLNEYLLVTMKGEGVRPMMDVPITVAGTLKVGETFEEGLLVGIYQLDGEKLMP